jgi:hypothetical protein
LVNLVPRRPRFFWLGAGILVVLSLLITGWVWPRLQADEQREAPEAGAVLQAQAELPFQILIPAYLPGGFQRESVAIQTGLAGPQGEPMVQLVYTHPRGVTLTLSEWLVTDREATAGASQAMGVTRCACRCQDSTQCSANTWMVDDGPLRIIAETSDPLILSPDHVRVILTTLAPASGLLAYSTLAEVPPVAGLPPAEEILAGADGVQEVVLVVTPSGYNPVHFSVRKDVPVRVVFRQLGEVGCGSEIYIQWGPGEVGYLALAGPSDTRTLEFTPRETGDFLLACPHWIYQGVMTVVE